MSSVLTLSSWAYLVDDAPDYHIGHSINLSMQLIVLCLSTFGIFWNWRENRLRAAGKRDYRLENKTPEEIADLGHKHPEFRYML